MRKYFNITKMKYIIKGRLTQVTTYKIPVELVIDPEDKTFKVDNGFWHYFNYSEITFITEDKSIIKYSDDKLTIVSEKNLK